MPALARVAPLVEPSKATAAFAADVLAGLQAERKTLPAKYFYDSAGSRLFERISQLPEYYPTRTELGILREHAADMAGRLPDQAALVEFGSGASTKASILLGAAPQLAAYIPVDISSEVLHHEADVLRRSFPKLAVIPVDADFCQPFEVPAELASLPRAGFFPGSTIGNFEPHEAATFLRNAAQILGRGATLIVGTDLQKDSRILNAAYNDAAGVTQAFNLNLLARINRELDGRFDLDSF
ncbi:MAG: L-histidine N(alpha)-methyltransferase, partial [Xanthobacteraceae bacterium]